MNPDDFRENIWEYQRLDEIYHQRLDAIKDFYYNDDNFDDEANVKRYSERELDMNLEVEKTSLLYSPRTLYISFIELGSHSLY